MSTSEARQGTHTHTQTDSVCGLLPEGIAAASLANEYIYTFYIPHTHTHMLAHTYLLVDNEAGEYYVPLVEYRIAKFMIDRLVH